MFLEIKIKLYNKFLFLQFLGLNVLLYLLLQSFAIDSNNFKNYFKFKNPMPREIITLQVGQCGN